MDIVALLEVLVKEIIEAEEKFLKNPKWKPPKNKIKYNTVKSD